MLKKLAITNFRNHLDYSVDLEEINIFIGPNGSGKTNILESIWFLVSGRSWRTAKDIETINWENDFSRIVGEGEEKLELILQKNSTERKAFKLNSVKKKNLELLGHFPGALFSPENLPIVDGAPDLRRRYLNAALLQTNFKYAYALGEYSKVLKERNKLLYLIREGRSHRDELDFWDEKLVSDGNLVIKQRKDMVDNINKNIAGVYKEISGKEDTLKVKYLPNVEADGFGKNIVSDREKDIEKALTQHGPHRDDIDILLGGRRLSTFGSRGEYRSAVLALKVSELRYIESKIDKKPALLLDDIFSELDADRRSYLAKIVEGQQTFITTTDLDHIDKKLRDKAKIVELG